jgi:hypothetical protein
MALVCGTGGWTGPQPGDPSTADIRITATPAFGGIDVNWTYPELNPNAVAYTEIWRSLLDDPASAIRIAHANGSFYYDRVESQTLFYYWVVVVSIYGTRSPMIGPAWATSKPLIEEMIELLTGQIDAGVLAGSLKTEIDQIQLNKLGITQETLDRDLNDDALGVRITELGATSETTLALVQEEVLARASQGEAFVSVVNTMYTSFNGNIAAVQETITVLQNDLGSLASHVDQVEVNFGSEIAQVQTTMTASFATVNGKITVIGALYTAQVNVNGLIGGFGIYNDGTSVEAGFDVDRFWIGRTGANKRKPFIIDSGVVYIDEAAINKLTFSKLRDESGAFVVSGGKVKAQYIAVDTLVVRQAQSDNYVWESTGWAFTADGNFYMNGRGGAGRLAVTGSGVRGYHSNGVLAFNLSI